MFKVKQQDLIIIREQCFNCIKYFFCLFSLFWRLDLKVLPNSGKQFYLGNPISRRMVWDKLGRLGLFNRSCGLLVRVSASSSHITLNYSIRKLQFTRSMNKYERGSKSNTSSLATFLLYIVASRKLAWTHIRHPPDHDREVVGLNPGQVIPKTLKMVISAFLSDGQH